jgi:hypothetical protein
MTFIFETDENVALKVRSKIYFFAIFFFKVTDENSTRSRSTDPYQNVTDPLGVLRIWNRRIRTYIVWAFRMLITSKSNKQKT